MRGYVICTTPRSGSNFLCQVLASTNQLGAPLEYFNPLGRRALEAPDFPDAVIDQVRWIKARGATPNGIYALKAFPDQFAGALRQINLFEHLPDLRFVRLVRRDLLGQAISWARALQTGQYRSTQQAQASAQFEARLVAKCMVDISTATASWDIYFARAGIAAPTLIYEDIVADPSAAVAGIAQLLDIEPPAIDLGKVDLTVQRDEVSEEWRECFVRECGDRSYLQVMSA